MTLQVPFTTASWALRDHTRRGLVGKEGFRGRGGGLNICIKGEKKCLPVGEGQYLFVVNSKC